MFNSGIECDLFAFPLLLFGVSEICGLSANRYSEDTSAEVTLVDLRRASNFFFPTDPGFLPRFFGIFSPAVAGCLLSFGRPRPLGA